MTKKTPLNRYRALPNDKKGLVLMIAPVLLCILIFILRSFVKYLYLGTDSLIGSLSLFIVNISTICSVLSILVLFPTGVYFLFKNDTSKEKYQRDLMGRIIQTEEDAKKVLKTAISVIYFFGIITCLIGLFIAHGAIISGAALIACAYFIDKRHSRTAAIVVLLLSSFEILLRIVMGVTGLLGPLVLLWFSARAVQATFKLSKFKK